MAVERRQSLLDRPGSAMACHFLAITGVLLPEFSFFVEKWFAAATEHWLSSSSAHRLSWYSDGLGGAMTVHPHGWAHRLSWYSDGLGGAMTVFHTDGHMGCHGIVMGSVVP